MEVYADIVDMLAALEFQKMFYAKYESSKIDLYSGTLQCCLKKVVAQRKPLLFILHNEDVNSSHEYWKLLPEFESTICEKFLILGWKVENRHCELLSEKILVVGELSKHLRNKTAGIFVIIPDGQSVKVYNSISTTRGDVVDNATCDGYKVKLNALLEKTVKLMSMYINEDYFNDMTSVKYQQWMYEELGDRDYDSFEPKEGELLKEKILYALYGPPKILEDETIGYEEKQKVEADKLDGKIREKNWTGQTLAVLPHAGGRPPKLLEDKTIGYEEKQKVEADKLYEKIREKNNEYSRWKDRIVIAFIYICTEPLAAEKEKKRQTDANYKPDCDFLPVPVFVVRKCKIKSKDDTDKEKRKSKHGCRIFIDNSGRVYETWDKYIANNKLPPCKMICPKDGRYCADENDSVYLEEKASPSCSALSQVLKGADIGAGVVGFLSGATLVAASFTPLGIVTIPAIIGGAASGLYSASRSTHTLVDRSIHEESISVTNPESRGAYLSIGASAFCVIGAGATKVLSTYVESGVNVGMGVQHTVTAINGVNVFVAGASTANGFYDVYLQYTEDEQLPSALTILQLGSSLFFFGNSVYNFRTGAAMVKEIQTNTLSEIEANLRSNRQRKTFNKLMKETVRLNGETQGRAEVILSMRNVDRNEVLAVLTRANKNFNRQGVRFAAEGGGISLNGVPVDIVDYGNLARMDQNVHLNSLPTIPETPANVTKTSNLIRGMKLNPSLGAIGFDPKILFRVIAAFAEDLQPKVIKICEKFMNAMEVDYVLALRGLFGDIKLEIIRFVTRCINSYALEYKRIFEERILNEDVMQVCAYFGFRNPRVTLNDFITYVIECLTNDEMMGQLKKDFHSWCASLWYKRGKKSERNEIRSANTEVTKEKKDCCQCEGYYYIPKVQNSRSWLPFLGSS